MVGVMSSIPSGGNFIFTDFETPQCQFCTKLPEMSDLCYLGKTRLSQNFSEAPLFFQLTNRLSAPSTSKLMAYF